MATPYYQPRSRSTPPPRARTPRMTNRSSPRDSAAPTPPPMIVTQQKISTKTHSLTSRARLQRQARLKLQLMEKTEETTLDQTHDLSSSSTSASSSESASYLPSTLVKEQHPPDEIQHDQSLSSQESPTRSTSSSSGSYNRYASIFGKEIHSLEDVMDGLLGKVAQLDQQQQQNPQQKQSSLISIDETTIVTSSSFGASTTEYYRQILDTSDTFSQQQPYDDHEEAPFVPHKTFDKVSRLPPLPPRPNILRPPVTTAPTKVNQHRRTMSHDTAITMNSSYSGETHDSLPSAEEKQKTVLLSSSSPIPPPVIQRTPTPMGAFVEDASSCEEGEMEACRKEKTVQQETRNGSVNNPMTCGKPGIGSRHSNNQGYMNNPMVCGKPGMGAHYSTNNGMIQGPPSQMCSEIVLQDPTAWKHNKKTHKSVSVFNKCQSTTVDMGPNSEEEENSMIVPAGNTSNKDGSSYDRFFKMAVMCGGMDDLTSAATIHEKDANKTKTSPQKTTFIPDLQSNHSISEESTVDYEKAREHPIFSSNTGDSSDDGDDGGSAESPELHPDSTDISRIFTNSFGTPEDTRLVTPNTKRSGSEVPMTPNRIGLEIPAFSSPTSINHSAISPTRSVYSPHLRQGSSPSQGASKSPQSFGLSPGRVGLVITSHGSTLAEGDGPTFPLHIKEPYVEPQKTISLTDDDEDDEEDNENYDVEEDESIRSTLSSGSESSYESYLTSGSEESFFSDEDSTRSSSSVEEDSEDDYSSDGEDSGSFWQRGRQRFSNKEAADTSRASNSKGGVSKELVRNTAPLTLNFIKLLALPDLPMRQREQLERRRGTNISAFFGKSNADKALAIQCKATDSFLAEITCRKSRTALDLTLENCKEGGAGTGIKSISLFCPNDSEEGEPSIFLSRDAGPSTIFGPLPYPLYMRFHRNGFDPKGQVQNIEYLAAGPMEYYFCHFRSGDTWWGSRAEDAPFHKICSSWDVHTATFGTPITHEKKREASWLILSCDGKAAWRNLPARLHNLLMSRTESVALDEKGANYVETCAAGIAEISLGSEDSYFVRFMDGSVDFCYSAKMEKHYRCLEEKGSTVTNVCLHPQLPFNFVMRSSH